MAKLTIKDADLKGKRIFARVDYNVPMEEQGDRMVINDATRITATLPTLDYLVQRGARIVLGAHLGRPKGRRDPSLSLRPVAEKLADMAGRPVAFVDECVGEKVEKTIEALQPGDLLMLENLRFHPGEEGNDRDFAARLAGLAEVYVNDAFGAAHRAHASTEGVGRVVAERGGLCLAGLLMARELRFLGDELARPERPFVVILGGAKVSDKIGVIDRLIERADTLLIGGAMAYTFKLAMGLKVGKSLVEPGKVHLARAAMEKAKQRRVALLIPTDHTVATPVETGELNAKGKPVIQFLDPHPHCDPDIPDSQEGVDIGIETSTAYAKEIAAARTLLWNGPMGIFEDPRFARGTFAIAKAVAKATELRGAKSIIGGGDSVTALHRSGLASKITFMSTGGGASLEFLEGKTLPGVAVLDDRQENDS